MRCWSRLAIVLNNVVNLKTMGLYLTHIWRCRARRPGRPQWIAYWHQFQPAPDAQVDRQGQPISIKLRKEEVKRSKEKLASGERILQKKDHVRSLTERSR